MAAKASSCLAMLLLDWENSTSHRASLMLHVIQLK